MTATIPAANSGAPVRFTVFIKDNFHPTDPMERGEEFDTYPAAVARCQAVVDDFLAGNHRPGMAAAELLAAFQTFAEEPFIVPPAPDGPSFSTWEYAEKRCSAICAERR